MIAGSFFTSFRSLLNKRPAAGRKLTRDCPLCSIHLPTMKGVYLNEYNNKNKSSGSKGRYLEAYNDSDAFCDSIYFNVFRGFCPHYAAFYQIRFVRASSSVGSICDGASQWGNDLSGKKFAASIYDLNRRCR